tara:strand:+ start:288 stop:776 length:489 start_codon:yes stop_codon:yes gene_type:complete
VVTEGHFSEVFNYKKSKDIFGAYLTAEKKALVVVNADVTVAYDLSKLEYQIDDVNRILHIISIPKEEIKISPDFEYYDIQADYFNPFEAEDYNRIKETMNASLLKRLEASSIKTNSLGWTLQYNETLINGIPHFKEHRMKMVTSNSSQEVFDAFDQVLQKFG